MNTTHLKTAIDESAAVAAFQQEAALSKVRRAKEEWKKLFEQFEHLTQRVLGCRDALNYGKERAEFRRNHFNGYCGATHTTNLNFLRAASEIGAIVGAIPILQDALSHNEKLLAEHKEKMVHFARQSGIGEEVLTQLEAEVVIIAGVRQA